MLLQATGIVEMGVEMLERGNVRETILNSKTVDTCQKRKILKFVYILNYIKYLGGLDLGWHSKGAAECTEIREKTWSERRCLRTHRSAAYVFQEVHWWIQSRAHLK